MLFEREFEPKSICSMGGLSGGGGSKDMNVTQTTTNPVVPGEAQPLANALMAIATAYTGAPVNLGAIPGLDAPRTAPTTPSMGNMFSSPAYMQGMNRIRMNGTTAPRTTYRSPNISMGSMFARPIRRLTGSGPTSATPRPTQPPTTPTINPNELMSVGNGANGMWF